MNTAEAPMPTLLREQPEFVVYDLTDDRGASPRDTPALVAIEPQPA